MTKNKLPNVIGIVGFQGSGKDALARQFIEIGYKKLAFANSVKDVLSSVFGWERSLLEGETDESRYWREQPDIWWEQKLNWMEQLNFRSVFPRFTPRVAMQLVGTDIFRKHFNDSLWILSLENKIRNNDSNNIVISDCRFPNEIKMIREIGGIIIKVTRGEQPEWYNVGIDASNGNNSAKDYLLSKQIHMSEWAWLNQAVDIEVYNNSTPEKMFNVIMSVYKNPILL